uniref:X-box-binding protein 1 n=1 Tax=Haematobia irritans TaxID=7368 RepID=A0A1L8EII2_HAEIR
MSAPTVFITVPKYVAITPITQATTAGILPKIKPAPQNNVTITPVVGAGSFTTSDSESNSSIPAPKGKKRRLDHLSWEEKIQRKKLKNRVAAQTSRDRKKARMEEMESEIKDLTARTEILVNKCESLQVINDSLLEKNQKLDMEVEQLRQQLQELQKQQPQHTVTTCAGCESLLNGSAAGIKPQGLSVDTGAKRVKAEAGVEKEHNSVVSVAGNSTLPTLQDMLLPDIEIDEGALNDAEFDAGKLEELAESLLADITADLEACDREGNETSAQVTSGTERLLGPMVGTTTECLESSQHTSQNGCGLSTTITPTTNTDTQNQVPALQIPDLLLESNLENENNNNNDDNVTMKEVSPMITLTASESKPSANATTTEITPDTVYGTYDAKTNSITVVMDDVAVPVNEVVEEIYWDGERSSSTEDMIYSSSAGVASPSQVFLNVNASCNENENMMEDDNDDDNGDDLNFDPIAKFLCPKRPLVSPLAKSPASSFHSATSDHGYESILGSPSSHYEPLSEDMTSDFSDWPPGFNELFPGLI